MCIQARQVGGDYYDFLHLAHERVRLVLGDISGKGIRSSIDGQPASEPPQPLRRRGRTATSAAFGK